MERVSKITKTQREKAERLLLKQMLDTQPWLKRTMKAMVNNENAELKDTITPILEHKLREQRTIGILIGWIAAMQRTQEVVNNTTNYEDIKNYIEKEIKDIENRLNENNESEGLKDD